MKSSNKKLAKKPKEVSPLDCADTTFTAIQTIEGQIHEENRALTLDTISYRYLLEEQKKKIEKQKEENRRLNRDIAIN